MASQRQKCVDEVFGYYMPDEQKKGRFGAVQKLIVISEATLDMLTKGRCETSPPAAPAKLVLLSDGADFKTAMEYMPNEGTVLSCEAQAFTRFAPVSGDWLALMRVNLRKCKNEQAMGAYLLLPLLLSDLDRGRLWLHHDLSGAQGDAVDTLKKDMLPCQGLRVSVAYDAQGFRLVDELKLVWCEDQLNVIETWAACESPEPLTLQAVLTGRKHLPVMSSIAQPATLDVQDAKGLGLRMKLYGKEKGRVSVHTLEHLLKAFFDVAQARESCGALQERANVYARVYSQYRRHVNDEREVFALVDRLRHDQTSYEQVGILKRGAHT